MARAHEHPQVRSSNIDVPRPKQDEVVVHGEGVRVDRIEHEVPKVEARARFGGLDPMAVLAGTMAGLGTFLLLSGLVGAVGRIGYEQGTGAQQLSVAGLVAGLVVLGLSMLFGGWVAGRTARYEGKLNGFLSGLLFVLLSAALAGLASFSDSVTDLRLPSWLDADLLSVAALASLVTGLIVALGAATVGGRWGASYHRRVDDALLTTRAGGLPPYPTEEDAR